MIAEALALTRATRLVTRDQITASIRESTFVRSHPTLEYSLHCPHCTSLQLALLSLIPLPRRIRRPLRLLVTAFAVAAVPSLIEDARDTILEYSTNLAAASTGATATNAHDPHDPHDPHAADNSLLIYTSPSDGE